APVGRVAELAQAGVAGGRGPGHEGAPLPRRLAAHDREAGAASRGEFPGGDAFDGGQAGRTRAQVVQEPPDRAGRPLHLDEHAGRVVADQPGQPERGREAVHERAESDALHGPFDADADPDVHPVILAGQSQRERKASPRRAYGNGNSREGPAKVGGPRVAGGVQRLLPDRSSSKGTGVSYGSGFCGTCRALIRAASSVPARVTRSARLRAGAPAEPPEPPQSSDAAYTAVGTTSARR